MRILLVIFLFVVLIMSIARADILMTAEPFGAGRWTLQAFGIMSNDMYFANSGWTLSSYGLYGAFGLTNRLDLYLQGGTGTFSNLLPGAEASLDTYGATLKYEIIKDGAYLPFSVAIGAVYRSLALHQKFLGYDGTNRGSQVSAFVNASKMISQFTPYAGAAWRTTNQDNLEISTQLDWTAGISIAWAQHGALFLEYTSQAMHAMRGLPDWTAEQYAVGIAMMF